MMSRAELRELSVMRDGMCGACADKLGGWIEAKRIKIAARAHAKDDIGALDKVAFVRVLTACNKISARCGGDFAHSVVLSAQDDLLRLYATDGEIFVSRAFDTTSSNRLARIYDAPTILRWLKSRKGKRFDAELEVDRVRFRVGKTTATFRPRTMEASNIPHPPNGEFKMLVMMTAGALRRAIARVSFAGSDKELRYAMNCILFDATKKIAAVAAIDGLRLAVSDLGVRRNAGKVLMPLFAARITSDLLRDVDGDVTVGAIPAKDGVGYFAVEASGLSIRGRVEGKFPPYREYSDSTEYVVKVRVDRAALQAAVEDVDAFSLGRDEYGSEERRASRLTVALGGLVLRSGNPEHRNQRVKIAGEFEGKRFSSALFNLTFLLDALKALDDAQIIVELNGENAARIRANGFCYVVMPVSPKKG